MSALVHLFHSDIVTNSIEGEGIAWCGVDCDGSTPDATSQEMEAVTCRRCLQSCADLGYGAAMRLESLVDLLALDAARETLR